MVKRLPNWPELLAAQLDELRGRPFVWGRNDCYTMAVECAAAMTGTEPGREFGRLYYGHYSTALQASRIIEADTLDHIGALSFGVQVPPLRARRGDVALVPNGGGEWSFAVVDHELCLAPKQGGGFSGVRLDLARTAWRVG